MLKYKSRRKEGLSLHPPPFAFSLLPFAILSSSLFSLKCAIGIMNMAVLYGTVGSGQEYALCRPAKWYNLAE